MAGTARATTGGKGLSLRLPSDVVPSHYRVHLHLDPEASKRYTGEIEVSLTLHAAQKRVVLHSCDLKVSGARFEQVQSSKASKPVRVRATVHVAAASETIELRPAEALAAGEYRLHLRFAGKLRDDLRGLYFAETGGRRYAFTQLEAADARRFFPCFDEPAFKAKLSLSVTTARAHAVLSNAPEASRTDDKQTGLRTTHFAETPKLSTYLFALAVGELRGSKPVMCGDTPIRVWHAPGSERMTGFALTAARETLARLENYFGAPYPYAKLDMVAVPDFEFGAMENAGAVFFRETLLLVDEKLASLPERKRAAEVICHELAHMWYGNLVTMAWWDDLWLNEAFATWMAFTIVDEWQPDWHMWSDFGHARNGAMAMDALKHTHPIYTEVRQPDEASENFDLITYEKGAAVVRMLERFLGPAAFRRGVRNYIRAHREGNTVAADLWNALQAVSPEPGVARMVRGWIEQPGFPLLRVERGQDDRGHFLRVRQSPYSAHGEGGKGKGKGKGTSGAARWTVPFVARVGKGGSSRIVRQLLKKQSERIELGKRAPSFVYANADEAAFLRPLHSPEELRRIVGQLDALNATERLGLLQHGWALTRSGHMAVADYLQLAWAYAEEADPDVLAALVPSLRHLTLSVAPSLRGQATGTGAGRHSAQAQLQAQITQVFGPALKALGLRQKRGEAEGSRLRRGLLIELLALVARDPATLTAAAAECDRYLAKRSAVDGNLAGVLLSVGALDATGGRRRFAAYLEASGQDPTPQGRRRFRLALSDFDDRSAAKRLVDACTGSAVPTQDVAIVLARGLSNPATGAEVWSLCCNRWPKLSRRMPSMLVSRFVAATPALGPFHRAEVASFFRRNPVPSAARALRQAEERFQLERDFRARVRPELQTLLTDES